jgi:serine/threonine-protein kinase
VLRRLALAAALSLAACAGRLGAPPLPPQVTPQSVAPAAKELYVALLQGNAVYVYEPGDNSPMRKITQGINEPIALAQDAAGNLYVANGGELGHHYKGSITMYPPGSDKPALTITAGLGELNAIAVDAAGDVFAANRDAYSVYEYAAGTNKIARAITAGIVAPIALAVDSAGYLYVSNCQRCVYAAPNATLTIYSPKVFHLLHTIAYSWRHGPGEMQFDNGGNLYVVAGVGIEVYAPHSTKRLRAIAGAAGTFCLDAANDVYSGQSKYVNGGGHVLVYLAGAKTPSYTIAKGIYDPTGLVTDSRGVLYVSNGAHNTITLYARGKPALLRTIVVATGLDDPDALAMDSLGNLYAANNYESTVTIYSPTSAEVVRTITEGVASPSLMMFDGSGNLYVASYYGVGGDAAGFVTIYRPGSSKPYKTLTEGIYGPNYAFAFDADGNFYVASGCPEDSHPIAEYSAKTRTLLRTIGRAGICPSSMTFDASGNLYVAVVGLPGDVSVFAPGSSDPKYQITDGVNYPDGVVFDASGNLYVSNAYGGNSRHWGSISVYHPGAIHPFRRLTSGLHNGPGQPTFAPSGDLYVVSGNEILGYGPTGEKPILIIHDRQSPTSPLFDPRGDLYVANRRESIHSSVTQYAPDSDSVLRTITGVRAYPASMVFGP